MEMETEPAVDLSMYLRDEEKNLALRVKEAVESNEQLRPISDFECAHLALSCGERTMEQIMDVAYKLQCFREMYRLHDTVEDGVATTRQLMEMQPGLVLDVSYLPHEECYTVSCDMAALCPQRVKTEADWRIFQGGFYYWIRATATNITTIRNGLSIVTECEGMGFHNLDIALQERTVHELWSYYPARHKESIWLNTPPAANMLYGVLKRILRKELMESWKIGGSIEGYEGRLDRLFLMPNAEIAGQALLRRLESYLTERYHNERTFRL